MLRNDLHLKDNQGAPNLWCLEYTEKHKGVCTAAMKVACLFGSTDLCESAFSDMNFIKSKHRTHLTDKHLQDPLRLAVSKYTPDYITLDVSHRMQYQTSHYKTFTEMVSVKHQGDVKLKYRTKM